MKYYCDIYKLEHNNLSGLFRRAGINPKAFNQELIAKSIKGEFIRPSDRWRYMKNYLNDVFRQKRIGVRVI